MIAGNYSLYINPVERFHSQLDCLAEQHAAVGRHYVEAYGPVLYLSPSLLQLELEIRPVLFVEVIVNLLR